MARLKPLPAIWLISDLRNDAVLEAALAVLPENSGLVFRHYHLEDAARRARFAALQALCRDRGHVVVLAGNATRAGEWGADGIYGPAGSLGTQSGLLRLATVHTALEIAAANHAQVDAMFLSPVFPTRSHPGGECLGVEGFRALAALAESPVIALGGMNPERAEELDWPRWAGIDAFAGSSSPA